MTGGEWDEAQHPRDATGKFGAGSGEAPKPVAPATPLKAFASKQLKDADKLAKKAFDATAKASGAKRLSSQMAAHEKAAEAHDKAMQHLQVSVMKGHISHADAAKKIAEHDKAAEHHEDKFSQLQKQHTDAAAKKAASAVKKAAKSEAKTPVPPKEAPKEALKPELKKEAPKKEAPKQESKPESQSKPKDATPATPTKPIGARGTHTKSTIDVPHAEVEAMLKAHGPVFKSLETTMKNALAEYPKKKELAHLSEKEQMLHVAGDHIGKFFEEKIGGKFHANVAEEWKRSSDTDAAQQLHGALRAMGISGHPVPGEEMKQRDKGAKNKQMHAYVQKLAAFHQAVYKSMGIKELTLYRGTHQAAAAKAKKGAGVALRGREAASFTTDPKIAAKFGRVLKYKVPVEKVLMSSLTSRKFNSSGIGEAEVVIMGSSKLVGHAL